MTKVNHTYKDIISVENLLLAWKEFRVGKRSRRDTQKFEQHLMRNIFELHKVLKDKTYEHSKYSVFRISDPKPRVIHKASVSDRLLHHALHRVLYPFFDKKFIADSYSCRVNKGSYAALNRFHTFFLKASKNNTRTCWVLKCDVRKFFASIDHHLLIGMLEEHISDKDLIWLLSQIVNSFELCLGKGIPLGNLTSQLFANIYVDKLDKFVKHILRVKFYIRYVDDFVFILENKVYLVDILSKVREFLSNELFLELHESKILLKTVASGIDFLGWVHFPDHRVLRTVTKRRVFRNTLKNMSRETTQSYLGLLSHGNTFKIKQRIIDSNFFG
ncbi:MAG: reverse transcriptase/maturase family protein [Patescibacteria group bacterium]